MHHAESDVHVLGSKDDVTDVCDAKVLQQHGTQSDGENVDELWLLQ